MRQDESYRNRQQSQRIVVWGCNEHRTPRGEVCQWCLDQGDLFGHADIPATTYRRRNR